MGFTKTSEGRVFFQNADNDDALSAPPMLKTEAHSKTEKNGTKNAPLMPRDNTQMQILMLLKSLNTKLKTSSGNQTDFQKQLQNYREQITSLEKKTLAQESNYIDLEQKVARKQNEVSKKAQRVETSVKSALDQLEEAKDLVKALEGKGSESEAVLTALKDDITRSRKKDEQLLIKQASLEKVQKEQGEKMVSNVAAYVALTKRVSESETKHDVLDNKIEDSRSDYIKLDRKIDRAIEDRNRILRKIERIEQAVLETRDALNAKALVLLTDQGVAGVDAVSLEDNNLDQIPASLAAQRTQEDHLLPWWRKPLRVQSASLILIIASMLFLGWLFNEILRPAPLSSVTQSSSTPVVSMDKVNSTDNYDWRNDVRNEDLGVSSTYGDLAYSDDYSVSSTPDVTSSLTSAEDHGNGITIHRGYSDPSDLPRKAESVNVYDSEALSNAFEKSPHSVAQALNAIEPGNPDPLEEPEVLASLSSGQETTLRPIDMSAPEDFSASSSSLERSIKDIEPAVGQAPAEIVPAVIAKAPDDSYIRSLNARMSNDPNLTDVARKIETQAFEGVPEAQHDMGAIYAAGHGQIQQDLDRAVFWFTEASRNGIPNATYNLGVLYHQGLGVAQNLDRAMTLYQQASDAGHPEAQYNLGIAYIEGIGVTYSPSRAAYYFQDAANNGITEAAYNLGLIYENGLLGQVRPDEALSWYKHAADQGSLEAESALNQLAASLGIGINDVSRIVEKLRAQKSQQDLATASSENASTSVYLVGKIQEELMRRGLYPGPVDGMNGPMTLDAIKNFQKAANLDVNGVPSQELLGYLQATARY